MAVKTRSRLNAIGVEIGTSNIKVVALQPGSPPTLLHALSIPTPSGSVRDGLVIEPAAVANELRALLDSHRISTRNVVVSVPSQSAVIRSIMVPRMQEKELREGEALKWQAERYIPFPIDEVNIDFALPGDHAGEDTSPEMEVLIAAATSEAVARTIEVMELAGLDPVAVDVKSFAATRALAPGLMGRASGNRTLIGNDSGLSDEDQDVTLIIEIGAGISAINLVRGSKLLLSRNITISADDFTTALQKALDLDFNAAEDIKLRYVENRSPDTEDAEALLDFSAKTTMLEVSDARISETLRPVITELITEIRRSLDFYRTNVGEIEIGATVLSGGGAKLSGLKDAISDALGFRVELAQPWNGIVTDKARMSVSSLEEQGPEFAVPVGLALRGVSVDPVSINLLPAGYRRVNQTSGWKTATYIVVPVAVMIALVPSLIINNTLNTIQADIDANTSVARVLAPARAEYARLNAQQRDLEQVTKVADQLQKSKTYWSSDLARFINTLPDTTNVALGALNMRAVDTGAQTTALSQGLYDGKTVSREFELSGNANTPEAVVAFLNAFETNPMFGVNFKSLQRSTAAVGTSASDKTTTGYAFTATVGMVAPATLASAPLPTGTAVPSGTSVPNGAAVTPNTPGTSSSGTPSGGSNAR